MPGEIGLVVALVGLIIAATCQVLFNSVTLKRFRINDKRLEVLEDEMLK